MFKNIKILLLIFSYLLLLDYQELNAAAIGPDGEGNSYTSRIINANGIVTSLVQLPDGRIAAGLNAGIVRIWDIDEPEIPFVNVRGHEDMVTSLVLLQDGRIASGSNDRTIRIWNINEPETSAIVLRAHGYSPVWCLASLPNNRIASGHGNRIIYIWSVDEPELRPIILSGHHYTAITSLIALPNNRIASGSNDNTIRIWKIDEPKSTPIILNGHDHWVTCLLLLSDGKVVSGSYDGIIRIWNIGGIRLSIIMQLWNKIRQPEIPSAILKTHGDCVKRLLLLPDEKIASAGSSDGIIRIWSVDNPENSIELTGHEQEITCLIILADGRIVSGSNDKTIRVWENPSNFILTKSAAKR